MQRTRSTPAIFRPSAVFAPRHSDSPLLEKTKQPLQALELGSLRKKWRLKTAPSLDGACSPFRELEQVKLPALLLTRAVTTGSDDLVEQTPTRTPHGRRVGFSAPASRQSEVPSTSLSVPAVPLSARLEKGERKQRQHRSERSGRNAGSERSVFFADQETEATPSPDKVSRRHKTCASTATEASTPSELSSQAPDSPNTSGPPTATNAMISQFGWIPGAPIGSGSYGCVFKALDKQTGRIFAVKKVADSGCEDDKRYRERLQDELNICKDLRHPNIVACLGFECTEQVLHIYLEYVPGGSMASMLNEFGPLEEPLLRQSASGLLKGLDYLHTQNPPIVHRDVKGANILVDLNFSIKLADFGCSKRSDVTKSFTTIGSIPWMAPEVIQQQDGYGRKADVWSVGCTLIEMATAEKPWGKDAFENVMFALKHIAMSQATPAIPESINQSGRDLISLCLRRRPDERPSASDLISHMFFSPSSVPRCLRGKAMSG